jgi:hypothetical protein
MGLGGRETWTYVLCTTDVPNFQEDDGEHLPGLVRFCGRGILPGEHALGEFAGERIVTLDDEVLCFREHR